VIDDATFGTRNAKGEWTPFQRASYGPLFSRPTKPMAILRWLPSYFFPWNALYGFVTVLVWCAATPSLDSFRTPGLAAVGVVFVRNLALTLVWFGGFHLVFYSQQHQGVATKFNARWPRSGTRFLFGSQTRENIFWSLASGVPMWTAFELLTLWLYANGHIRSVSWADRPVWVCLAFLLVPFWREVHFYAVHRFIHAKALYETVHSLHHRNTNPGPWSGLSMHPLEHLLYFTAGLLFFVVPVHPVVALYALIHAGMAPAPGHLGFERIAVGSRTVYAGGWNHYLHHKYFEVNYSDGAIPFDRWFGSFHDGSPESHSAMKSRIAARRPRSQAPDS
jgi:sterol desaturase/sphingolipid hydroxylase (fatty acid hydroxylase superfamily)